ncbi:MAG: hypothetical protein V3W04_03250 [Gammaproteobacteria bacterium]
MKSPAGTAEKSLALPRQLVISGDGNTLYIAAKGSDKVGIFTVTELENNSFVPDSADHVHISGGGPAGLLLDETHNRLYVTSRFDNGLSIINTITRSETDHIQLANPEPADILVGRRFLYDANMTSSNGEAACGSVMSMVILTVWHGIWATLLARFCLTRWGSQLVLWVIQISILLKVRWQPRHYEEWLDRALCTGVVIEQEEEQAYPMPSLTLESITK